MFEFTFDWAQAISLMLGVILPIIVGLVTTRVTKSGVKAVLLALLSILTSLLTEILNAMNEGKTFDLGVFMLTAIGTFVIAVATHYGLWKPTTVSEKAQNVLVTAKDEDGTHRII